MHDWQTWAAPAVVILTLLILVRRFLRRRGGCGSSGDDCRCDHRRP